VSHLAKADWGLMANGAGLLFGREAQASVFLTAGPLGLVPRSGRVAMNDTERKLRIQAGELFTDLRGSGKGVSVSWRTDKSSPTISVLAHDSGSRTPTLLSYAQQFAVGSWLQMGGEVGSNGSGFAHALVNFPRVEADYYYRYRPEYGGGDSGIAANVDVWRGVLVSGAIRTSGTTDDTSRWEVARVRVPLPGAAAVSFERSTMTADARRSVSALLVQVPFKRVQFMQRIQFGHSEWLQRGVPVQLDGRLSQTATNYSPGPWGNFTYQQSMQWLDDDHVREWDEVGTTVKFGRKTSLQATTAFPDLLNPQRLRARVKQEITPRLALEVQYGMLSAFQLTRTSSPRETPTFMVTMSKVLDVRTPTRGGSVQGQVVDQAKRPVQDVPVKLGPYKTVTDEAGRYRFSRVPSGKFDVSLDKEKLPVSYASEDEAQTVTISTSSERVVDFEVMPLNAIRGRVYIDRNRNNAFDGNEGVAGIPVAIGTWVTATEESGAFAFYNQPPGSYVVRLDLTHLPDTLVPASDSELDVELPVDRPVTGLEFRLQPKQRPIIMQALP
jgi:hypothetical protein